MRFKYYKMQISLKIIAVFFILVSAITMPGCRGTTPLPSMGSSKPKYAYLNISTTPSNALVYMKSHATMYLKKRISIFPMNIEQPDNENAEWELIGTTSINKHKVLYESHGRVISLFACASWYVDISIDLKIEKDGYKTIFLDNVSFNSDEYTQLNIDLVQTETEK